MFFVPVMVLTALAIKFDGPGPIIFRQNRKGFNGQQFVMFKFRTMSVEETVRQSPKLRLMIRVSRRSAKCYVLLASTNCRSSLTCFGARCR